MGTPGQTIVRRYRLVRALGQGTTGVVWEAHDTLLDRAVAVREVMLPAGLREGRRLELVRRLAGEARQAERLRHPNIAAVHDYAEDEGTPYIVMELVRSRSLDGVVAGDGPLPVPRAASIARQVLSALAYAHASGVRHGDVRPANVLLGHDGRVLLADFGAAVLAADPAFTREVAGRSPAHGAPVRAIRGAAAFLAPERADAGGPTRAADLWALGATLHTAVTGRPPLAHRPVDPAPVPEPLRAVVAGLLARDPRKRLAPEDADRLLAALEPAPEPPVPARRGSRTRLVTGVVTVAALAGALGGWAVLRPGSAVDAAPIPLAGVPDPTSPVSSASSVSPPSPAPVRAPRPKLMWFRPKPPDQGWRAAVPRDWTRFTSLGRQSWYQWLDSARNARFEIEITRQRGTDPLGSLHEAEAVLYPDVKAYRRLRLASASSEYGTAADWEFTFRPGPSSSRTGLKQGVTYRQFRRVLSTGATTSVLTWTAPADEWESLRPTLARVVALFTPPTT
ncbi:serine/threonine-protein kinase [Microtetraspora niveoalba]|uniref:serine/threonine-protein kinase n=1 Tax=Microtetraspora niveoalba TaxID=46175 RepID=UPI00082FE71D|nr:serine/threonine-protein kinase [Microtetraspora niveoalba]